MIFYEQANWALDSHCVIYANANTNLIKNLFQLKLSISGLLYTAQACTKPI